MAQLTLVLLLLEASVVCFLASASVLEDNKEAARTTCGLRPVDVTETLKRQPASWLQDRIVGGKPAKYGQYPWQARLSIQQGCDHRCGGVIIDEYWILTAAHCLLYKNPARVIVHVGDLNRKKQDKHEQRFRVAKMILHEKFNLMTVDYDIALIKLKPVKGKGIQFSDYVKPAYLPEADTPYTDGKMCLISGWGQTSEVEPHPILLQGVEVPLFNQEVCRKLYSGFREVTPRMVCAGSTPGWLGPCYGDSGGPLVCKEKRGYTVMGIVSWGKDCWVPKYPDVFARVGEFLPWIAQKMKQ